MDFPRAVLWPGERTATVHFCVLATSITPLNLASLFQNPLLPTLVDRPKWGNGVRTMTMLGTVSLVFLARPNRPVYDSGCDATDERGDRGTQRK